MRRILFGIIFTFCVLTTFGQTASEHLTFKGIPIDGTLESFVGKLKGKGYKEHYKKDNFVILEGEFAGYKNCLINIGTSKDLDLVYRVLVTLPFSDNWNAVYKDYDKLKRMLTEKHGKPDSEGEDFMGNEATSDGIKRMYTEKGYCNYFAEYNLGIGGKKIAIGGSKELGISVFITYYDFLNEGRHDKKAMDDL